MAHILIVEDNTTMREGIVQILSSMGHEVHGAPSGKEGLQYFHFNKIYIYICIIVFCSDSNQQSDNEIYANSYLLSAFE